VDFEYHTIAEVFRGKRDTVLQSGGYAYCSGKGARAGVREQEADEHTWVITKTSHAKLEIYNVMGEQITTLIDETRPAGYYSERFDATGLASGLYFYRLQAEDFVDTRKLLLLK